MEQSIPEVCEVCSEPLDPDNNATCHLCGRRFHMAWDTRLEIKSCGRFDVDDTSMALFFTCNVCLGGSQA